MCREPDSPRPNSSDFGFQIGSIASNTETGLGGHAGANGGNLGGDLFGPSAPYGAPQSNEAPLSQTQVELWAMCGNAVSHAPSAAFDGDPETQYYGQLQLSDTLSKARIRYTFAEPTVVSEYSLHSSQTGCPCDWRLSGGEGRVWFRSCLADGSDCIDAPPVADESLTTVSASGVRCDHDGHGWLMPGAEAYLMYLLRLPYTYKSSPFTLSRVYVRFCGKYVGSRYSGFAHERFSAPDEENDNFVCVQLDCSSISGTCRWLTAVPAAVSDSHFDTMLSQLRAGQVQWQSTPGTVYAELSSWRERDVLVAKWNNETKVMEPLPEGEFQSDAAAAAVIASPARQGFGANNMVIAPDNTAPMAAGVPSRFTLDSAWTILDEQVDQACADTYRAGADENPVLVPQLPEYSLPQAQYRAYELEITKIVDVHGQQSNVSRALHSGVLVDLDTNYAVGAVATTSSCQSDDRCGDKLVDGAVYSPANAWMTAQNQYEDAWAVIDIRTHASVRAARIYNQNEYLDSRHEVTHVGLDGGESSDGPWTVLAADEPLGITRGLEERTARTNAGTLFSFNRDETPYRFYRVRLTRFYESELSDGLFGLMEVQLFGAIHTVDAPEPIIAGPDTGTYLNAAGLDPDECTTALFVANTESPCTNYDTLASLTGDWGGMACNHRRVYSTRQIQESDLPVGIGWRCDQHNNFHVGFDSVESRTSSWSMPYANTECQNSAVLIDWHGSRRTLHLANNEDNLVLWVRSDRFIDYYINGVYMATTRSKIPSHAFPVDFELSDAGNVPGYYRNLRWYGINLQTAACAAPRNDLTRSGNDIRLRDVLLRTTGAQSSVDVYAWRSDENALNPGPYGWFHSTEGDTGDGEKTQTSGVVHRHWQHMDEPYDDVYSFMGSNAYLGFTTQEPVVESLSSFATSSEDACVDCAHELVGVFRANVNGTHYFTLSSLQQTALWFGESRNAALDAGPIAELEQTPHCRQVRCGRSSNTSCRPDQAYCANPSESHAVRCCSSDGASAPCFVRSTAPTSACPDGVSAISNSSNCGNLAGCVMSSYSGAAELCGSLGPGARLCTAEELASDCTAGSGCGFDNHLTWSSSFTTEPATHAPNATAAGLELVAGVEYFVRAISLGSGSTVSFLSVSVQEPSLRTLDPIPADRGDVGLAFEAFNVTYEVERSHGWNTMLRRSAGVYLDSSDDWLRYNSHDRSGDFSILDELEDFFTPTDRLRLRLVWPEGQTVTWEQAVNPVTTRRAANSEEQDFHLVDSTNVMTSEDGEHVQVDNDNRFEGLQYDGRGSFLGFYGAAARSSGWSRKEQWRSKFAVGSSRETQGLGFEVYTPGACTIVQRATPGVAYRRWGRPPTDNLDAALGFISSGSTLRLTANTRSDAFESPSNVGHNLVTEMVAVFTPKVSGFYTFLLASNDQGRLWLNPDGISASNSQEIANVTGWTQYCEWDKYSGQRSSPQPLCAGRSYYMRAVAREGGGADHLEVAAKVTEPSPSQDTAFANFCEHGTALPQMVPSNGEGQIGRRLDDEGQIDPSDDEGAWVTGTATCPEPNSGCPIAVQDSDGHVYLREQHVVPVQRCALLTDVLTDTYTASTDSPSVYTLGQQGDSECPAGWETVAQDDCLAATLSLRPAGVQVNSTQLQMVSSLVLVPHGCSVQSGEGWTAHFNAGAADTLSANSGAFTPVCAKLGLTLAGSGITTSPFSEYETSADWGELLQDFAHDGINLPVGWDENFYVRFRGQFQVKPRHSTSTRSCQRFRTTSGSSLRGAQLYIDGELVVEQRADQSTLWGTTNTQGRVGGLCEAECDNDDECAGDLRCFQRDTRNVPVPGCAESAVSATNSPDYDYCYDPYAVSGWRALSIGWHNITVTFMNGGGSAGLLQVERRVGTGETCSDDGQPTTAASEWREFDLISMQGSSPFGSNPRALQSGYRTGPSCRVTPESGMDLRIRQPEGSAAGLGDEQLLRHDTAVELQAWWEADTRLSSTPLPLASAVAGAAAAQWMDWTPFLAEPTLGYSQTAAPAATLVPAGVDTSAQHYLRWRGQLFISVLDSYMFRFLSPSRNDEAMVFIDGDVVPFRQTPISILLLAEHAAIADVDDYDMWTTLEGEALANTDLSSLIGNGDRLNSDVVLKFTVTLPDEDLYVSKLESTQEYNDGGFIVEIDERHSVSGSWQPGANLVEIPESDFEYVGNEGLDWAQHSRLQLYLSEDQNEWGTNFNITVQNVRLEGPSEGYTTESLQVGWHDIAITHFQSTSGSGSKLEMKRIGNQSFVPVTAEQCRTPDPSQYLLRQAIGTSGAFPFHRAQDDAAQHMSILWRDSTVLDDVWNGWDPLATFTDENALPNALTFQQFPDGQAVSGTNAQGSPIDLSPGTNRSSEPYSLVAASLSQTFASVAAGFDLIDSFAVRWRGGVNVTTAGIYDFRMTTGGRSRVGNVQAIPGDNGARVFLDETVLLESTLGVVNLMEPDVSNSSRELTVGVHPIHIVYFQASGYARLEFEWKRGSSTTSSDEWLPLASSSTAAHLSMVRGMFTESVSTGQGSSCQACVSSSLLPVDPCVACVYTCFPTPFAACTASCVLSNGLCCLHSLLGQLERWCLGELSAESAHREPMGLE